MVEIYAYPSHAPQLLQPLQHILLPHVWQCSLKKGFGFWISCPNKFPSGSLSL
jgi:hypothetical protein